MASNIKVAIEVDNKQYIANLKAADNATQSFASNTERSLSKVNTSFDTFTRKMGGLKTLLTGLAFGAVGKSALQMADSLQDLSNSSGIAVSQLLELKKALEVSGGEADSMPQAINTLLRSIDEAAGGSIKAQNAFMKLGVSLSDLGALSERDLMIKTLEGIAKLPSASERATAMMQNFGKSFKTVNPQELLDKLNETAGTATKYAESIRRAAELNDQLATAQGNLKLAFLEAFSGPIQKIIEFNTQTTEGAAKMETLTTAIKAAGIALATAFAISGALGLVTVIGQIGRAITVVLGLSAGMGGIFAAAGSFMVGLRGAVVLVAALGTSIYAASQLFDDFGSIAGNALARVIEAMGRFAASILNLPTDALAGILRMLGMKIDNPFGLGDGLNKLVDQAERARKDAEYIAKIGGGRGGQGGPTAEQLAAAGKATITTGGKGPAREVDTTARAQAIAQIKEMTAEYEKQQRLNLMKIDLETRFIGQSEDAKQLAEAQVQLATQYSNQQDDLIKKRNSLGKEEQYLVGTINEQIKKNAQGFNEQFDALTKSITAQQTAKILEKDRLTQIENMTKAMEQQAKIQEALGGAKVSIIGQKQDVAFAGSKIGRGSLRQQFMDIEEANRKAGLEAARAFAQQFEDGGDGLTPERAQKLTAGLEEIAAGYKDIADAQKDNLSASREWDAGWKAAFEDYRANAFDAAQQSKDYFKSFTDGMTDALVEFVRTGKLSFTDLANTMIAQFIRIQAQKAMSNIGDFFGMGSTGSVGVGGLFASIGKIFGFANGGNPPVGRPSIVGERGPELFVPKSAGTIVPNGQFGQGGNQVINNSVAYSIQAVDASSFRALVARDPEFIHNVVEQGRRSMPIRSRR
jgi:hypothetical protein